MSALPSATISCACSGSVMKPTAVPALPRFAAQYPDLKLDVSLNDRIVDIIEEGIDAVVRVGTGPDSRLIMHRIATARFVVCAAPSYLERYGEPQTPEDLKDRNCVNFIYPQTGRDYEWLFQRDGIEFRLPVEGNFRIDHAEALLDAAIGGAGLIQVYNYIAGQAIASGKLKPVLESYAAKGSAIAVIYPQKRHLSAKVRAFVDFMSELMAVLRQDGQIDLL